MSRYQLENDWFGLYAGDTSADALLFPRKRHAKPSANPALFDEAADDSPDPVAHPAKMSLPLLRKILATMAEFGWLAPGQTVVDPFGGRGSTAAVWCAMHPENRAATVEIEPHFVAMQQSVKAGAEKRLGRPLRWEILQGDSRKADALLGEAGVGVSSPPYGYRCEPGRHHSEEREMALPPGARMSQALRGAGNAGYGRTEGQIGVLPDPVGVLSPPYGEGTIQADRRDPAEFYARTPSLKGRNPNGSWFRALASGYVNSPGNIDNLGDVPACVTSPPYENAIHGGNGIDAEKLTGNVAGPGSQAGHEGYSAVMSPPYEGSLAGDDPDKRGGLFRDPKRRNDRTMNAGYAAVTSPPFEPCRNPPNYSEERKARMAGPCKERLEAHSASHTGGYSAVTSLPYEDTQLTADRQFRSSSEPERPGAAVIDRDGYGQLDAQIGNTQNETYASACGEVYKALARAGVRHLALVTKNPTRGGKLRRLDKLTARLLREAGYRVVGWRRAWLFLSERQLEALRGQDRLPMETAESTRVTGRLSFFRRLHMKRGGVAAAYEDVFFAELVE